MRVQRFYRNARVRPCRPGPALLTHCVRGILPVLTYVFDQLRVRHERQRDLDRPWFGVRLGVVDGYVEVHVAEVDAMEALDRTHRFRVRMAAVVKPGPVVEARGFDHESVAFPLANRVSVPGRIRI